jgi:hypothetical protein
MYKKIIGIVVLTLLITTALPAIGISNIDENKIINSSSLCNFNREIKIIDNPLIENNRGAHFIQLPATPNEQWDAFMSDIDQGWRHFDDFWNISGPICDIHWWGFSLIKNDTLWIDCDGGEDMLFDISFYHDDGTGKPGVEECIYNDISPEVVQTGIYYRLIGITDYIELLYFSVDLDPCCQLSDGWVSVFKTYNPNDCTFAWMVCPDSNWNMWAYNITENSWIWANWDLSFILTDGEPDIPDLECDGEIRGRNMPPGIKVYRNFTIRNNGDTDSILHWYIESYPDEWGDNWSITPDKGILLSEMDWITIDVEFNVPLEENEEFTGKIKVVNAADTSDYCEIDVSIKTPRSRSLHYKILLQMFERFPYAFPILRQILGLI